MEHTILHQAGFTVVLESDNTVTLRENGKLPSLDDIARDRAYRRYMAACDDLPHDDDREFYRNAPE